MCYSKTTVFFFLDKFNLLVKCYFYSLKFPCKNFEFTWKTHFCLEIFVPFSKSEKKKNEKLNKNSSKLKKNFSIQK